MKSVLVTHSPVIAQYVHISSLPYAFAHSAHTHVYCSSEWMNIELEIVNNAEKIMKYRQVYSIVAPPSGEQKRPTIYESTYHGNGHIFLKFCQNDARDIPLKSDYIPIITNINGFWAPVHALASIKEKRGTCRRADHVKYDEKEPTHGQISSSSLPLHSDRQAQISLNFEFSGLLYSPYFIDHSCESKAVMWSFVYISP